MADVLMSNRDSRSKSISHTISAAGSLATRERVTSLEDGRARRNERLHLLVTIGAKRTPSKLVQERAPRRASLISLHSASVHVVTMLRIRTPSRQQDRAPLSSRASAALTVIPSERSPRCHPERAQRVEGSARCHPERAQRVEGSAPRAWSLRTCQRREPGCPGSDGNGRLAPCAAAKRILGFVDGEEWCAWVQHLGPDRRRSGRSHKIAVQNPRSVGRSANVYGKSS